ncbi:MAG: bifunctional DNA-formamidopyrimidine glycosylase/DNA-(apurinic or apyrimidinic site) lyase [Planctomycetota bacterium]|jgi:formamidopyrimidine-DNA glycosylase
MPELPEVETAVRQLRPRLVGRSIVAVEVAWARTIARPSVAAFRRGLVGRRITAMRRRAKYFVLELDDGRLLVGHLRMSGRLFVVGKDEVTRAGETGSAPKQAARPAWIRATFGLDDGSRLLFSDVRKFGRLALVRRLEDVLPPLGPEPLSAEMDAAWMVRQLAGRKRQLKPLLLDQSFLAGLGNIYVDEALHRAGLHPLRISDRVPPEAARRLVRAIRAVLRRAIAKDGSSFDSFYRTPEGQPGRFQETFSVYGRTGRPCRTCGGPIRRIVVAQRGTHLCPRCQTPPRARRPARAT